MPEISIQTNLKINPEKVYTSIQLSKIKYNKSPAGAECRKRYVEKNRELNKYWVFKSITKKKIENQTALVDSLADDVKIKARYVKLLEYNKNRLLEIEQKIKDITERKKLEKEKVV